MAIRLGGYKRAMITHNELFDDLNSHAVRVRVQDTSGTILLERPEKRNAISRHMLTQLRQALEDLHQEKKVRAVILTGAGGSFSAGADLVEIHEAMSDDDAQTQWLADCVAQKELVEQMLRFPKPIIAAVNGPALGLGATLVLASDLAVGTERATFGFPETQRGLVSGLAASLLTFRLGAAAAAHFLLSGEPVGCDDCKRWGIYRWVVGEELVWAKADAISRDLSSTAPEAVAMSKRLLNETIGEQLLTCLSAGAAATAAARTTEAAAEGIAAFLEKRPPQWP